MEALKNATQPSSKEDVRSFLASASRMSVRNFSKITASLRELIKDRVPFRWDTEEKEAFEKLRDSLSNDSLLAHFEPGKAWESYMSITIALVLVQRSFNYKAAESGNQLPTLAGQQRAQNRVTPKPKKKR